MRSTRRALARHDGESSCWQRRLPRFMCSPAAADPEIRVLFVPSGVGYRVVTVVLYAAWGAMGGERTVPLGSIDELIQVAVTGLPWWEGGRWGDHPRPWARSGAR